MPICNRWPGRGGTKIFTKPLKRRSPTKSNTFTHTQKKGGLFIEIKVVQIFGLEKDSI